MPIRVTNRVAFTFLPRLARCGSAARGAGGSRRGRLRSASSAARGLRWLEPGPRASRRGFEARSIPVPRIAALGRTRQTVVQLRHEGSRLARRDAGRRWRRARRPVASRCSRASRRSVRSGCLPGRSTRCSRSAGTSRAWCSTPDAITRAYAGAFRAWAVHGPANGTSVLGPSTPGHLDTYGK
jgi:hypothetical protein